MTLSLKIIVGKHTDVLKNFAIAVQKLHTFQFLSIRENFRKVTLQWAHSAKNIHLVPFNQAKSSGFAFFPFYCPNFQLIKRCYAAFKIQSLKRRKKYKNRP